MVISFEFEKKQNRLSPHTYQNFLATEKHGTKIIVHTSQEREDVSCELRGRGNPLVLKIEHAASNWPIGWPVFAVPSRGHSETELGSQCTGT